MIIDYRQADLPTNVRALCDYAVKLTLQPGEVCEQDVIELRNHDWDDQQIHLAAEVIGYFNYINRIADGLGVELEPWMEGDEEKWRQEKADYRTNG